MTFEALLQKCNETAYAEDHTSLHEQITKSAVAWLANHLKPGARVLDLGCGSGVASRLFKTGGLEPVAVSVLESETSVLKAEGIEAHTLDMHDVGKIGTWFDAAFARHVLEHSPAPFLVLCTLRTMIRDEGWLYVEVPAPSTGCAHECNPNHWSVFGPFMWMMLIQRAGWEIKSQYEIPSVTLRGPDIYHGFLCQTKS